MCARSTCAYERGVAHFDIALQAEDRMIEGCTLPMPGDHNVSNALAAVAVARHLGMKRATRSAPRWRALAASTAASPAWARWAASPSSTITATTRWRSPPCCAPRGRPATGASSRCISRTATRLSSLFDDFCGCFNEADVVAIAEVYAAGEDPIPGASRDDLVAG